MNVTVFENDNNIGTYSILTNTYCIAALTTHEKFNRDLELKLENQIPLLRTSISNCRVIGHIAVGNSKGFLVPDTVTDVELQYLRNNLPESVKITSVEDRFSALGNVITCNDSVALIHPELDRETEECIVDALGVEVFRQPFADNNLIGTHIRFNNQGCMVSLKTSEELQEELSALLQLPIRAGSVNYYHDKIGLALVVNDWTGFAGRRTTCLEKPVIESAFNLSWTKYE